MFSDAYRRARRFSKSRSGSVVLGYLLAATQAICWLGLLVTGGLLLELAVSGGITRLSLEQASAITSTDTPRWLARRILDSSRDLEISNTGLYPVVSQGRQSSNPLHAGAAALLDRLLRGVPAMRENRGALACLMGVLVTLLTIGTLCHLLWTSVASSVSSVAASALRNLIHRQIYRLGQSALPSEGMGQGVELFTREVNDVRDGLVAEISHLVRAPLLIAGLLLIALFCSWQVTIFLVALSGLVLLVVRPLTTRIRSQVETAARDAAVRVLLLQEDLGMLRTVRVYGMEEIDRKRYDEHLAQFEEADARRIRAEARLTPLLQWILGVTTAVGVGLLVYLVLSHRISPTIAGVLALASASVATPIAQWFALHKKLRQAGRSAEAIFRFLERRPELQQSVDAQFLAPLKSKITFDRVSLEGSTGKVLLNDVSFEIPARSRTAVLSLEESSKHAVACLIPRLIDPRSGKISMDGHELRQVTLESLRAQVAMILQADLVFNDTVLANIGLGDASYALPKIIEAAKVAHAHHLIQDLPDGYDTAIGSLGHYLSPDEQYRIALARAYLHDPSIVVIEEPDSLLDEDVKGLIDDTIDRLSAGRTLIFLPHRLSTIRRCDRVIVLHNGKVEASGSPREVHAVSKLYRHIQYMEFNQFATGEIEAGQMG